MLFLFCFCTDMAGEEDEQQRLIREARMRKGKEASTASTRGKRVDQKPYVPKTRRRRDARAGVKSSQSQMDYCSQVVDPAPAHDYAGYANEGFVGYDRWRRRECFISRRTRERMRRWKMMSRCQRILWWIILTQIM